MMGLRALTVSAAIMVGGASEAGTLVDLSPAVVGGDFFADTALSNIAADQNWLVKVHFDQATTVSGMSIYSDFGRATIGQAVTVKVRSHFNGQPSPALSNYLTLSTVIDVIDTDGAGSAPGMQRIHASFDPLPLAAGDWWFGMTSTIDIGWASFWGTLMESPEGQRQLFGNTLETGVPPIVQLTYRLDGFLTAPAPVPIPAAGVLLAGALAGMGFLGWRRSSSR